MEMAILLRVRHLLSPNSKSHGTFQIGIYWPSGEYPWAIKDQIYVFNAGFRSLEKSRIEKLER